MSAGPSFRYQTDFSQAQICECLPTIENTLFSYLLLAPSKRRSAVLIVLGNIIPQRWSLFEVIVDKCLLGLKIVTNGL